MTPNKSTPFKTKYSLTILGIPRSIWTPENESKKNLAERSPEHVTSFPNSSRPESRSEKIFSFSNSSRTESQAEENFNFRNSSRTESRFKEFFKTNKDKTNRTQA